MSVAAELAQAARRVRALNERLPAERRLDVAVDWHELREHVHGLPDRAASRVIDDWTADVEQRIRDRIEPRPIGSRR